MVRIRKKILLAACLAVLGMSLLLAGWLFPIGAQQQSVDVPSISYDLGFLGSGTELDDPLAPFEPYTLLSGEDDLLFLLGQLQSNWHTSMWMENRLPKSSWIGIKFIRMCWPTICLQATARCWPSSSANAMAGPLILMRCCNPVLFGVAAPG